MSRININRSGEMEVFVRVVELGGFSHAARQLGMTQSAVSKLISRLEARLGTRLFNRSTRRLDLTAEGCTFYERASAILSDIEEAERHAGRGEQPVGRIRLNTSASYAAHVLEPVLPMFQERYTEIVLDIVLTDSVIDLLAERTDVVVRAGPLKDSSLVARKLGESPMIIVAAPDYLERVGTPRCVADLERHKRIGFGYPREIEGWRFISDGEPVQACPAIGIQASDGETVRRLAIKGFGLARLAAFTVRDDIASGRLMPVLDAVHAADNEAFHAVYTGQGGPLPTRVRTLLNFLAEHGKVD